MEALKQLTVLQEIKAPALALFAARAKEHHESKGAPKETQHMDSLLTTLLPFEPVYAHLPAPERPQHKDGDDASARSDSDSQSSDSEYEGASDDVRDTEASSASGSSSSDDSDAEFLPRGVVSKRKHKKSKLQKHKKTKKPRKEKGEDVDAGAGARRSRSRSRSRRPRAATAAAGAEAPLVVPPFSAPLILSQETQEQLRELWKVCEDSVAHQYAHLDGRFVVERHQRKDCTDSKDIAFPLQLPLVVRCQFLGLVLQAELFWVDDIWSSTHGDAPRHNHTFLRIRHLPPRPRDAAENPNVASRDGKPAKICGQWFDDAAQGRDLNLWFVSLCTAWRKFSSMVRNTTVSASGTLKFMTFLQGQWISLHDLQRCLRKQNERRMHEDGPGHTLPMFSNPQFRTSLETQHAFRADLVQRHDTQRMPECLLLAGLSDKQTLEEKRASAQSRQVATPMSLEEFKQLRQNNFI